MKLSDLIAYKNNAQMIVPEKAFLGGRVGQVSLQEISLGIQRKDSKAAKLLGTGILELTKAEAGDGMWIPYLAGRSTYGYLSGGQSWAASGPYSGCYFEVGTLGGRTYVAHISCEGKTDQNVAAWNSAASMAGKNKLFSKKISMAASLPAGTTNAATIVFASLAGGSVSVTRVDVQTRSAGGMSGPIFDVQQIASD